MWLNMELKENERFIKDLNINNQRFQIRFVEISDVERLEKIFKMWVISALTWEILIDEIDSIILNIKESYYWKNCRKYLVVADASKAVIWIIWCKDKTEIEPEILSFSQTQKPLELVNFFVSKDFQWKWLWKVLLNCLIEYAKSINTQELIVNSWVRYKDAWWFYDKYFERVGMIENYYWKEQHACIWSKKIK